MELKENEKYTLFGISKWMAHTYKREIKVVKFDKEENKLFFKEGRKRMLYNLNMEKDIALFEGWELPFVADSDTGKFQGNALLNVVGDLDQIKEWFENKQLNPLLDKFKLTWRSKEDLGQNEKLVYPEQAKEKRYSHAVIDKMIEKEEQL